MTLSVGGNDLDFSDIVKGCFLRLVARTAPACDVFIEIARDKIQNGTLQSFIETTMVQIINKSTRDNSKLFFTGYPAFFHVDTQLCNEVSFALFVEARVTPNVPCDLKMRPCLTQELRRTVNQLTFEFNHMLSAAAKRVNAEKGQKVHLIDPNPAFDGHRWCEVDEFGQEVNEPDKIRAETWSFLSNWPDNKLDGRIAGPYAQDPMDLSLGDFNTNTTPKPPSSAVCGDTADPKNDILCAIAQINEDPTSPQHQAFMQQHDEIRAGNFSANHIKWWMITSIFKTFHRRTLGEKAYADLIIEAS